LLKELKRQTVKSLKKSIKVGFEGLLKQHIEAWADKWKISDVIVKQSKPVVVCCMGVTDISESLKILENNNIPHYLFPEAAARSMANLANYSSWLNRLRTDFRSFEDIDKKKVAGILAAAKKDNRTFLPEPEAHEVLRAYGFPVLEHRLAKSENECVSFAKEIGYPVVLKIVSPDILHKVDVGGVKINIKDEEALKKEYNAILASVGKSDPKATIWGIFVQQMAEKGKETIIGMNRDPHFGPMLMFGMGGVYVEAFKDVTFRIAPIRELSAKHMIQNIRSYKILEGVRGEKPSDIETITECLQRLSQLVTDFEEIMELDINPLIVYSKGKGARVVDARILI